MFGPLGGQELLLVFVIALIVFGPRKLPEIGKSLGKMISEFRRASNDLKRTIEDEVEAERVRELSSGYSGQVPPGPGPSPAPPPLASDMGATAAETTTPVAEVGPVAEPSSDVAAPLDATPPADQP